jgi:small subunit ribosomal protein S9
MFWFDDKRRPMNFEGYGKVSKTIPAMPWEYLKVEKPSALKLQKDLKVEKDEEGYVSAKGKRKRAHAVVKVKYGNGNIIINGKSLIEFCVNIVCRDRIIRPLLETKLAGYIDIKAEVTGGGIMGQSFALRQALGTALIRMIPASSRVICSNGFLRKDPRQVERKKTSKFKARKAYTYVKR